MMTLIDNEASIQCHLADVTPTLNKTWAKSAITEFKEITNPEVNFVGVSLHGAMKNESFPVYIWVWPRLHAMDPLADVSTTWTNVNEPLSLQGFAKGIRKFNTIVDCVSWTTLTTVIFCRLNWIHFLVTSYEALSLSGKKMNDVVITCTFGPGQRISMKTVLCMRTK